MPESFTITPAADATDLAEIRGLFTEYARGLGVDLCFQGFAEELATLPGLYAPPRGALLLARKQAVPAGCVAVRPRGEGVCEMKRLYVRPEFRGSGLGRALAERIIETGRRLGYRRMVLDTLAHMRPALRLYDQLGFRPSTPYYHNPLPEVVFLSLALDAAP